MHNIAYNFKIHDIELTIFQDSEYITRIDFGHTKSPAMCEKPESSLLKETEKQLIEYLDGTRKFFDLPLAPEGTEFQKKVWNTLMGIPYGSTASYKEIAEKIDCPKGFRAVGLANNRNPIPIIIPCHRVIGTNGSLTGYAGGLWLKESLIDLEREYAGL